MLGIGRSATGRRWVWRGEGDGRAGLAIAQRLDLPELVGRLLAARGVGPDAAADFLEPTLRVLLPDPSVLADMDAAASRLASAVREAETVAVFGDYDVDGACSGALMVRALRELGCEVTHYVPDRIREGYGPNPAAIRELCARGATLIVCVDCGIAAHAALEEAKGQADVIVLDHHKAEGRAAARPRGGEPEPAGLRIGAPAPLRRRGRVPGGGGAAPGACAAPGISRAGRSRGCSSCSTWWRWRRCAT